MHRKEIGKKSRLLDDSLAAWTFMIPGLIILIVFVFWPIIYSLPLAFTNYSIIGEKEFIGLANFKKAFSDPDFIASLKNSVQYILIVPFIQVMAMIFANVVNQKIKGATFFRTLYYIPVVTSTVAVSIVWSWLLSYDGFINNILHTTGLVTERISWLSDEKVVLWVLMFITAWKGIGYYMMIYLSGLQSIPSELVEAAKIDGANKFVIFSRITMPMLRPQIFLSSLMSLMSAIRVFDEPFVLTKGGPGTSSLTASLYIYQNGFERFNFGYAAALGLILSLIVLVFSLIVLFYNNRAEKGERQ